MCKQATFESRPVGCLQTANDTLQTDDNALQTDDALQTPQLFTVVLRVLILIIIATIISSYHHCHCVATIVAAHPTINSLSYRRRIVVAAHATINSLSYCRRIVVAAHATINSSSYRRYRIIVVLSSTIIQQ